MTSRRIFLAGGVLLVGVAAVIAGMRMMRTMPGLAEASPAVPTTTVTRGTLELDVHMDGDLRASRQQAIMAPTVGGALRVLSLVESGTAVSEGDVILAFDPADQQHALEQAESELLEAEQEIIKRRADTEAQAAQDKVTLLTEQFNVRRAELDAAVDEDLIPANDYKIRQASLEEARRTLAQAEQDVKARETANSANLSVLEEKRAKAKIAADRARQNIENLVIRAPIDGVVSVRDNTDASGGIYFSGMTLPPYRVGDTVNPGRPVLDIFDVSRMEIRARVNEQERANVDPGQPVQVHSSAAPDADLAAKVTAVSGLGRQDRMSGPLRMFDVTLALDRADPRLLPGTSVDVVVTGDRIEDALLLPRQAVFEKDGTPVVYARAGSGFEARDVKVLHRTEAWVAVDGLSEGDVVALLSPDTAVARGGSAAPSSPGLPR